MILGFHEERFDGERSEEDFGFGYVDDGFGAMSGEETGVGIFGDAGVSDQIAAGQQIDSAAQFFGERVLARPGPPVPATVAIRGLHELHGANTGGSRFGQGREHESVMEENVADLLLAIAGTNQRSSYRWWKGTHHKPSDFLSKDATSPFWQRYEH